jgi:DNA-directed RNA polymerase specialized sigma24 family protein
LDGKGVKKKDKFYVRNKDLLPHIYIFRRTIEFDEEGKYVEGTGKITEEFGEMLLQIAKNYSNKGNFSNYTWKDDMIAEAVFTCIKYMHNFDPIRQKRPNPFAYFTTIIHRSFLNYIRKQKKHSDIKDVCYKNYDILDDSGYTSKGIDYQLLKKE